MAGPAPNLAPAATSWSRRGHAELAQSIGPSNLDTSRPPGTTDALVWISSFSSFGMISVPSSSMVLHDRLVRQVAELDVADELVDAELVRI